MAGTRGLYKPCAAHERVSPMHPGSSTQCQSSNVHCILQRSQPPCTHCSIHHLPDNQVSVVLHRMPFTHCVRRGFVCMIEMLANSPECLTACCTTPDELYDALCDASHSLLGLMSCLHHLVQMTAHVDPCDTLLQCCRCLLSGLLLV